MRARHNDVECRRMCSRQVLLYQAILYVKYLFPHRHSHIYMVILCSAEPVQFIVNKELLYVVNLPFRFGRRVDCFL